MNANHNSFYYYQSSFIPALDRRYSPGVRYFHSAGFGNSGDALARSPAASIHRPIFEFLQYCWISDNRTVCSLWAVQNDLL